MDLLKLFDKNLDLKRQPLRPSRSSSVVSEPINHKMLHPKVMMPTVGTDYAQQYIDEENKQALEAAKVSNYQKTSGKMDELSVGTVPTNVQEIDQDEALKVYDKYNFEHRAANLPIFAHKEEIVSTVETHSVTIIEGVTGCGKSTQVPLFILDSYAKQRKHCNIIVSQPRRLAAVSIAKRVSDERQYALGSVVGCQVGMYRNVSKDTKLTYCTTGVLLRKLVLAKNMLEFTHIVLDEVHERGQEMDFLILVIRKLLRTNSRQVKIILMSATFNVDKFAKYFSIPTETGFVPAPVISIGKKRNFKIHNHYLCQLETLGHIPEISEPRVTDKMITFCIRLINVFDDLDKKDEYDAEDLEEFGGVRPRYATLIFLPGIWEIEEMHNHMMAVSEKNKWDIVVLHSSITSDEQRKVFENPPKGHRRIILSTNIAESSITINNIKYVIDFCLTKQLVTDPTTNFQCLELSWASKANCEQRAGRAGRVMDGRVYRLVTKRFYDTLRDENDPEIARSPLENLVLQTKLLDMGEPKALLALAIDPPDLSNLERTILLLKEVGGLIDKPDTFNRTDGELTDLGRIMAALPLDVHQSKLIALGHVFNVLKQTIIMAAAMSCKSMFDNPFQKRMDCYNAKVHWAESSSSDCMAYLNAYERWKNEIISNRLKHRTKGEQNWAFRNRIQIKVMHEIDHLVNELELRLKNLGIKSTSGPDKYVMNEVDRSFILKVVIAGAFYPNYFVRSQASYEHDATYGTRGLGGLDPMRTVFLQGWKIEHPGRLYAKRIQDVFDGYVPAHKDALVEFDGSSRVYVMFSDDKNYGQGNKSNPVPGRISASVYKALKMRKLGLDISIPVLDLKSARQRAEQLNVPGTTCSMFYSKENYTTLRSCLPATLPILPGLLVKTLQIKIVTFIDPSKFWVQVENSGTMQKLMKIDAFFNNSDNQEFLTPITEEPQINCLVAAQWEGKKMYRALIESFYKVQNENVANLFYIDYGFRKSVRVAELKIIDSDCSIAKMPALAFSATLKGVEPSTKRNSTGRWTRDACELFQKRTTETSAVYGEVYSVVDSIVSFIIKVDDPDNPKKKINLNELLEQEGFAEPVEESYLSKYNNELRQKSVDLSEQREYYEFLQYDKSFLIKTYPEPPKVEDCRFQFMLKGPCSPLEINLTSLAVVATSKRVTIENTSVNSVLLDTNPQDPHERLLVSAIVSQNTSSTNLTLRNTTFMPNIPGLTALICLIFAPKIELRRSAAGTYYIGALCGLGSHPKTNAALLPEHDMEVCFDTEITIEDLQNINRLRHWMDMGICARNDEADEQDEQAIQCQCKVAEFFSKLIDRKPKYQQRQKVLNFGCWGLYNESLFLMPTKANMMKKDSIFPLHRALILEHRNEELEYQIDHVQELKYLAASDPRISEIIEVECKLCKKTLFSRENLRLHLFSKQHKDKERELNIE